MSALFARAAAVAIGAFALSALPGALSAQQTPPPAEKTAPAIPAPKPHGPGASGAGDGSGMGQDTSESGTPKGPGDKGGPPADATVAPAQCDDGRAPVGGACPH